MNKKQELEKIKNGVLQYLSKLSVHSTAEVGHEGIRKIVAENSSNEEKISYILSLIANNLNSLKRGEKKESIKLLSTVCIGLKNVLNLLGKILTILQDNITEDNTIIFNTISDTFGDIILNSLNKPEESNKNIYELLQGFCIYNIKQDFTYNQICGSMCLISLIENCPIILQSVYTKYIWENIIHFIDQKGFNAKTELINCLISLIFACENLFKPYATVSLYKILDYLTDSDWMKRKLALNVVYTLVIYCEEEILHLKSHIVDFLKVLKCDKVKEVREVCMQTLKLFNEIDDSKNETETYKNKLNTNQDRSLILNEHSNSFLVENKTIKKDKQVIDIGNISSISFLKHEEESLKKKVRKVNKNTPTNLKSNQPVSTRSNRHIDDKKTAPKEKLNVSQSKRDVSVNRKTDNSFVNAKMVIKRDPSYSIFKTPAIEGFFKKSSNENIQILIKDKHKEKDHKLMEEAEKIQDEIEGLNEKIETFNLEKKEVYILNDLNDKTQEINNDENQPENNIILSDLIQDSPVKSTRNEDSVYIKKIINKDLESLRKSTNNTNAYQNKFEISDILKQINQISERQIHLLDTIEKTQESTKDQFVKMNSRIISLESTVSKLLNIISSKEKDYNTNFSTVNSKVDLPEQNNYWARILQELKNKNPTEAFNISFNQEDLLIKLVEKISPVSIKETESSTLNSAINRVLKLIKNPGYKNTIFSFLKTIFTNTDIYIEKSIKQNIKQILQNLYKSDPDQGLYDIISILNI